MPREIRKRGKRHKKNPDALATALPTAVNENFEGEEDHFSAAGPSWIKPREEKEKFPDLDAPFGIVNADLKAYFRTIDVQLRNWSQEGLGAEEGGVVVEDRSLLLDAALSELSGQEKALATDPDCSMSLERLLYSMDDFARRVLADRFSGSYDILCRNRFASHVCQTLFSQSRQTILREIRGIIADAPSKTISDEDSGELRTFTQMILDICDELLPHFPTLIRDPFASHVIRALLVILHPQLASRDSTAMRTESTKTRSKKSAKWKEKQGPMASVLPLDPVSATVDPTNAEYITELPPSFRAVTRRMLATLRAELDGNEIRALGADKVASLVLQMLLEIEADHEESAKQDSLMDRVLAGLITTCYSEDESSPTYSDYIGTLLRDTTASHLLETLVSRAPALAFNAIWETYLQGRIGGRKGKENAVGGAGGLAHHPVANFVVARAIGRVNSSQLTAACAELGGEGSRRMIEANRTGVLRAMVDRAVAINDVQEQVVQMTLSGIELPLLEPTSEDLRVLVPAVLQLLPISKFAESGGDGPVADAAKTEPPNRRQRQVGRAEEMVQSETERRTPTVQGALLLQSILHLGQPHHQAIVDSILAQSSAELLALGQHPISSCVLDALLDSPTVALKSKRAVIMAFKDEFHVLADDRIGSRVAERLWDRADPYLKEKIGRSLIPHEDALAASYFGRFFARRLNLYLLKKDAEAWKDAQLAQKKSHGVTSVNQAVVAPATTADAKLDSMQQLDRKRKGTGGSPETVEVDGGHQKRKKKKRAADDEIDAVFEEVLARKKFKRGKLKEGAESAVSNPEKSVEGKEHPDEGPARRKHNSSVDLDGVLGAIRTAPKETGGGNAKKKKKR